MVRYDHHEFKRCLYAFPGLILAIAIVAILGPGLTNVVIAIIVFRFRFLPASCGKYAESEEQCLYRQHALWRISCQNSLCSHSSGSSSVCNRSVFDFHLRFDHDVGFSQLSRDGCRRDSGVGALLSNARIYIFTSLHYAMFPGLAIFLTVLCFNLLGDALRSALDPKLSEM